MRTGFLFSFATLTLSVTLHCHAATLLPVGGGIDLDFPDSFAEYAYGTGSYTVTESIGTVSGSSVLGSDPSVSGSITANTLPPHAPLPPGIPIDFDSESSLFYQFMVTGPAGQTAPINIASVGTAAVSALGTGFGLNATAYFSIFADPTAPIFAATACAGDPSQISDPCSSSASASGSFNILQTLYVQANTAYFVNIYTSDSIVTPAGGAPGGYYASSSVDPTIVLATTDPAYSLEFSPGLLNATPEPSSLALVGTGLAGVLALVRRKPRADGPPVASAF